MLFKNTADQYVGFYLYDKTTGDGITGATINNFLAYYHLDGADIGTTWTGTTAGNFVEMDGSPTVDGGFYWIKIPNVNADEITINIKLIGNANAVATGLSLTLADPLPAVNSTHIAGNPATTTTDPLTANVTKVNGVDVATGGTLNANVVSVDGDTTAAEVMAVLHGTVGLIGTIQAGSTDTIITSTDVASLDAAALADAVFVIGGTNPGAREPKVVASTNGTNTITLTTSLSAVPTTGDTYVILGKGA